MLYARPNYKAPITQTWDVLARSPQIDPLASQIDGGWIDRSGNTVPADQVLAACNPNGGSLTTVTTVGPNAKDNPFLQCVHAHGWLNFVAYQPADRFWLFRGSRRQSFSRWRACAWR